MTNSNKKIITNPYVYVVLCILFAVYAKNSEIKFPQIIKKIFTNPIFQIIFLTVLVMLFNKKPHIALIVAIIFVLSMDYLDYGEAKENFEFIKAYKESLINTHK